MKANMTMTKQVVRIMRGDEVISERVTFEKPSQQVVQAPPPIQRPPTPPSPKAEDRPDFLEPLSPTRSAAIQKAWADDLRRQQEEYLIWEADQPDTWRREIENLERMRERYNKKAAWAATDVAEVEKIDKRILELQIILNALEQRLEEEYYSDSE